MGRRLQIVAAALTLVLGLSVPAAATVPSYTPAPGKPCQPAGSSLEYEGKQFTCVKRKGKLGWSRPVKIKQGVKCSSPGLEAYVGASVFTCQKVGKKRVWQLTSDGSSGSPSSEAPSSPPESATETPP